MRFGVAEEPHQRNASLNTSPMNESLMTVGPIPLSCVRRWRLTGSVAQKKVVGDCRRTADRLQIQKGESNGTSREADGGIVDVDEL